MGFSIRAKLTEIRELKVVLTEVEEELAKAVRLRSEASAKARGLEAKAREHVRLNLSRMKT